MIALSRTEVRGVDAPSTNLPHLRSLLCEAATAFSVMQTSPGFWQGLDMFLDRLHLWPRFAVYKLRSYRSLSTITGNGNGRIRHVPHRALGRSSKVSMMPVLTFTPTTYGSLPELHYYR
jgi:hypothetical protein